MRGVAPSTDVAERPGTGRYVASTGGTTAAIRRVAESVVPVESPRSPEGRESSLSGGNNGNVDIVMERTFRAMVLGVSNEHDGIDR